VSAEAGAPDSVAQAWAEAPRGLSSVQTGGLGEVLTALQRLCGTLAADMDRHVPAVTAAASASARWGGEGEMCDLRAFCAALAAAEDRVADVARQTVAAIDACSAGPVTMPFAAGLSTAPAQFRADGFTETSGWGEMTRLYRNRLDELMHRTFDDRRHDGAAT